MKQYTPYIFPLAVASVVFLLLYRWYTLRAQQPEYALLGEGVSIENLSQEELADSLAGVGDYQKVELTAQNPEDMGVVRYEVTEDTVRFSVSATLPESETEYRVWLKSPEGTAMREAFVLEASKGGFIGSASLPSELLPLEVIVSTESEAKAADENSLLRGTVTAPEQAESQE